MPIIGIITISISIIVFILTLFYTNLREHIKLILPTTVTFVLLGYGLIIYERVTELTLPGGISIKTLVEKTVDDAKFVNEIRDTVVRQSSTIGLTVEKANEMQLQILRVNDEVKKFEGFLDNMRENLQKDYQILSEEVSHLRIQNNLPMLGDKAISEGDRVALEEIRSVARMAPENSSLKNAALEQIRRVVGSLPNASLNRASLAEILGDETVQSDHEVPTNKLIMSLDHQDPKVRAKAAMLMSNRKEIGVPDVLLKVARTDKNLLVVYYALASFGYVTERISMPSLAGTILLQITDMFEIEKLERWWNEHSSEIYEKLVK
jgi:hypothetical protein